jgi:uncharacterized protein (DUF58 family)
VPEGPSSSPLLLSLYLLARKVLGGSLQAERRSVRTGAGITFSDYAEYNLGDDYRSIDWQVYARFEHMVVKLFEVDEDTTVYVLLDASASMRVTEEKFLLARQLAAALGYIGLHSLDQVIVHGLADRLQPLMEKSRGRSKTLRLLQGLDAATTFGAGTDFTTCCREFQARHSRKGIVIVISDFFFPGGYDEGLKFLQWHKHDVFCLQVQDLAERTCDWKGDVDLTCLEASTHQKVTITAREAAAYADAVTAWNEGLRETCARRGIGLCSVTSDQVFDTVIRDLLRRGGLVA